MTEINTTRDILKLEIKTLGAADRTARNISRLSETGIGLLARMKFTQFGSHPRDIKTSLNLIEQVNQTFTYLATFAALRFLLKQHPDAKPFLINLGTDSGNDIESEDGTIVAEVFAAVDPNNNRKLQKDIARVDKTKARFKYVFVMCPKGGRLQEWQEKSTTRVKVYVMGVTYRGKPLL